MSRLEVPETQVLHGHSPVSRAPRRLMRWFASLVFSFLRMASGYTANTLSTGGPESPCTRGRQSVSASVGVGGPLSGNGKPSSPAADDAGELPLFFAAGDGARRNAGGTSVPGAGAFRVHPRRDR